MPLGVTALSLSWILCVKKKGKIGVMITSMTNPKVKQVVLWQKKARERRQDQVFLAEGRKMFGEAPDAWIREAYLTEGALEKVKENPELWKKIDGISWELVADEVMEKMADTQTPQGILTVLRCPQYELEPLLDQPNGLFLLLEDLQDPGNLGTIMRTSEGAGITAVILNEKTVDIFNPKTIRATMGSIYRVPFVIVENLEEMMPILRKKGIRTFAAHLAGENYYTGCSFQEPTAFLIGNEGNGLSKELSEMADSYIKIPMEGKLESLNAAVAAALLMYEAKRQRSLS